MDWMIKLVYQKVVHIKVIRFRQNLWQEKKEGSGCNPRTSLAEAKRCPKSAANEGTEVSLLAHTASLCKCSSFNFDLTFVVLTSFFPAFSSLSELGLWETDVKFDALLSRPLLPMFFWLKYFIEQLVGKGTVTAISN